MLVVKVKINLNQRKLCFEIFGYDFIIDDNLNVWLIEVNTNPCLEESSPLLKKLVPRMLGRIDLIWILFYNIDDAFKLTIDRTYPQKENLNNKSEHFPKCTYSVDSYSDNENLWFIIIISYIYN